MKKNQPPSSTFPSVKELRNRYEQLIKETASSVSPSAKVTQHKPSHMKDRLVGKEQAKKTLYETATSPQKSPRLKEPIAKIMQQNLLVEAYQEEIRHWCGIVYGYPSILQERIEEIQKNPDMGEQISREVAENPASVHHLAGHQMLGVKTNARKNAEDGLLSLCAAIEGYVCAVKQVQESIVHFPYAQQSGYEQERIQRAENLQKLAHPEKEMTSLSNEEISNRIQRDPSVQYGEAEIRYWCQIVFGNAHALQYRVEDMQKNPNMGEELSWQVSENPNFFHKLAGSQALGIKNSARKEAEAGLSFLCNAIEAYADTVKQVRKSIVQTHQAQQNHQELSASRLPHDVQKQKSLSKPPKLPEHSPADKHQESAESSTQTKWNRLGARPRTVPLTQESQKQQEKLGMRQSIMEGDGKETTKVSMPAIKATEVTTKFEVSKAVEQLVQPPKVETAKIVSVSLTQEAQKTLIEKETVRPLSYVEVASKIRDSEVVKSSMKKIETLCGVVYGNPRILEGKIPKMGIPVTNRNVEELEKFARQVGNFPSSYGKIAGFSFLGIKSEARAHAAENFLPLSHAIFSYAHNVKQAEKDILEAYSREQERCAQSVETPSEEIRNLLSLSEKQQKEVLLTSPELGTQVKAYSQKLHDRLSQSDLKAINERSHTKLAENLGTSVNQAEKIAQIFKQTKGIVQILQKQEKLGMRQSIMEGDGKETAKISMSVIKATKVITKIESSKLVEQPVRPQKIENAKIISMSR
ncbi:BID domain-containing T4SS effector [Bartonella koehlerae]|uniref:Bartonella effector protein BID domain-containing protein n=1 Tax=Bartonella koehlerae C-29 TaxID=1134510 RepID=A0A067WDS6_9HYPH|nr:BID domain-containing T4SS effector [Bartonella koehlerae]KEC54052.1 hypothetical protein O9A_01442 [Bartonella koehlerae C-29]